MLCKSAPPDNFVDLLQKYTHPSAVSLTVAGMMRQNGLILKPIAKKECGEREIWLYKKLEDTVDRSLIEFRGFVPKFYGIKTVSFKGQERECIVLEDLTKYYREPCVMDIKIGRRTWDPKATYEKIVAEEVSEGSSIGFDVLESEIVLKKFLLRNPHLFSNFIETNSKNINANYQN